MNQQEKEFSPKNYWDLRLKDHFDLTGVGFRRKSVAFNRWVYRTRSEVLNKILKDRGWETEGKAVLDVGAGTGYFIDYWLARKADPAMGIDIAEISIEKLRETFPKCEFRLVDLGEPQVNLNQKFDYVSVFDVLFHIVNDERFENAARNLAALCNPGAIVFITDIFGPKTIASVKHCRNRSLDQYNSVFSRAGFKNVDVVPLFYTLLPPARFSNTIVRWGGILGWELITFVTRWSWCGNIMGRLLYSIDKGLRKVFKKGPGGHLAVFEYSPANPTE
jgi:SAM-dependent methyltransferase